MHPTLKFGGPGCVPLFRGKVRSQFKAPGEPLGQLRPLRKGQCKGGFEQFFGAHASMIGRPVRLCHHAVGPGWASRGHSPLAVRPLQRFMHALLAGISAPAVSRPWAVRRVVSVGWSGHSGRVRRKEPRPEVPPDLTIVAAVAPTSRSAVAVRALRPVGPSGAHSHRGVRAVLRTTLDKRHAALAFREPLHIVGVVPFRTARVARKSRTAFVRDVIWESCWSRF